MLENMLSNDFSDNFFKQKYPELFLQIVNCLKDCKTENEFIDMINSNRQVYNALTYEYCKFKPMCYEINIFDKAHLMLKNIHNIPKCKYKI